MPRAIVVTPDMTRTAGGMRHSVPALWRAAAAGGIGVEFHTPLTEHFPEDSRSAGDLDVHPHRIAGPRRFAWCPSLAEALCESLGRGGAVASLHGLWMGTGLAVRRAVDRTGAPLIVHPHGMLEAWAMNRSRAKKWVAMRLFEGANIGGAACLRALTEGEAARFRELGLEAPIAVIPNPVDVPGDEEIQSHRTIDRTAERVFLFMSRIHPKKGLPELLHAWSTVRPGGWRLDVVGPDEGGHLAEVEALAAKLRLGDAVRFPGPLHGSAKARALATASAFVLPSHSEGMPMAVLEAAAWGLPVVLTPGCHFPELASCGGAIQVDPRRDSLSVAISSVCMMSDAERSAMGARGRALVASRCGVATVGASMAGVVQWLSGAGPRPGHVRT